MMHLHSASHARPLAACLAGVLVDAPLDPMTPEWLAVPTDGMRRWLTLELAGHLGASVPGAGDGVGANFVRAYPGTLRSCVLDADRRDSEPDPWAIERMVWAVLGVADRRSDDPDLSAFVSVPSGDSRFARARRVADLFDRYHLHRPAMVRAWSIGRDIDGTGRPLAGHAAWQPHLWRLVRDELSEPSPPERLPDLVARAARGELSLDLPDRIVLFGFTLLPGGGFLELARAVAERREVHLFLLEPSRLDAGLLHRASPRPAAGGVRLRSGDSTSGVIHQPLLRSWGRLHRETACLLADAEADGVPAPRQVEADAWSTPTDSLLGRLQADIRANAASPSRRPFDPQDRTVQFHSCFGATRQVEVLRDALLHLLNQPGTAEDDILVLCPDLERFAPLIQAVFGPSDDPLGGSLDRSGPWREPGGAPALRYRIADQSIRSMNPILSATAALLELVAGRFDAATVLDFLALGPVRERFGFDDEGLADVAQWISDTNVRWGLDPFHRRSFDVPESIRANTWQAALDRLLLGAAVYEDELTLAVGDIAPYGIEGSETDTAGLLAQGVWHLSRLVGEAGTPRPIADWVPVLRRACEDLFATDREGQWQMEALDRMWEEVIRSATADGVVSAVPLDFVDIRHLLDERLEAMPGRPDYFRGGITISSMTPLRWVPFRVVCILGMDQAAFGSVTAPGDDLAATAPQFGDRDPRAEARQALLEAVLAAGRELVVFHDGHDVRTNQEVPRAVVAAELFEAVCALVEPGDRAVLARQLEIGHPRHSFDERCFEDGAVVSGLVWGFDPGDLDGAMAKRDRGPTALPFLVSPLDASAEAVVDLGQLRTFFKNPAGYFLSRRLEARLPKSEEEPSALLPVELDPLERWQVATRLLSARMAGVDTEVWRAVERQRGTLPPGTLEDRTVSDLAADVDALVCAALELGVNNGPAAPFEIDVTLPGGTHIVGSVPLRLLAPCPGPAHVSYSRLKPEHRVAAWLDLMALVGTDPSVVWRSVAVGKPAKPGGQADVCDIGIAGDSTTWRGIAVAALEVAVDCFQRGQREPIPLFPNFSYGVHTGKARSSLWSGSFGRADGDDGAVILAHGRLGYHEVINLPARRDDPGHTGSRVARFAGYLYGAMDDSTVDRESRSNGALPLDEAAQ